MCHPLTKSPPDEHEPAPRFNGPILVKSCIIQAVASSAAEAELRALFYNAKDGCMLRNTLEDMGHPQPATPIQADNACAVGLANGTVKQKRSKAIDMRFYWEKDRVKAGQFIIYWRKGSENDADYFTKHHAPSHHRRMRSRCFVDKLGTYIILKFQFSALLLCEGVLLAGTMSFHRTQVSRASSCGSCKIRSDVRQIPWRSMPKSGDETNNVNLLIISRFKGFQSLCSSLTLSSVSYGTACT